MALCVAFVWHWVCPEKVMFGMGFVCLPSVQVMFGMGFVCSKHGSLIVFGIFGSPEKDCLLVLKRTGYCSRSYILPSCQATAPSLLK